MVVGAAAYVASVRGKSQSHDMMGEGVLERAPVSSPQDRQLGEDKRSGGGKGTINKGRGRQKMGGNNKDDNNAQQLLLFLKSHYMLIFYALPSCRGLHGEMLIHRIST